MNTDQCQYDDESRETLDEVIVESQSAPSSIAYFNDDLKQMQLWIPHDLHDRAEFMSYLIRNGAVPSFLLEGFNCFEYLSGCGYLKTITTGLHSVTYPTFDLKLNLTWMTKADRNLWKRVKADKKPKGVNNRVFSSERVLKSRDPLCNLPVFNNKFTVELMEELMVARLSFHQVVQYLERGNDSPELRESISRNLKDYIEGLRCFEIRDGWLANKADWFDLKDLELEGIDLIGVCGVVEKERRKLMECIRSGSEDRTVRDRRFLEGELNDRVHQFNVKKITALENDLKLSREAVEERDLTIAQLRRQLSDMKHPEESDNGSREDVERLNAVVSKMEKEMTKLRIERSELEKENFELRTQGYGQNVSAASISTASSVVRHPGDFHEISDANPRGVIQHIRDSKGIDVTDPATQLILSSVYKTCESMLVKLSVDIYSSDSRFALELIQNGDDNQYEPSLVPSVHIACTPGYVWVTNNERGFTMDNVRAICDVGGSTKTGSQLIGHKGVGFKAVFKVSDRPHIFSKGYRFKFDARKKIGHIVPQWIDDGMSLPRPLDERVTTFYLPLKEDHDFDSAELIDGVDFVPLFLRKLREIRVSVIDAEGRERLKVVTVEQLEDNRRRLTVETYDVSSVCSGKTEHTFKIFSADVDIPLSLRHEGGRRGDKTQIVLAFPDGPARPWPTFTFLPVQSVGFKMIVQTDMELVTSRQEVHKGHPWNKWLRDQIAPLFLRALQEDEDVRSRLPDLLPTPQEVTDGFWSVVANQMRRMASDLECIKSESGNWCKPSQILLRSEAYPRLVDNDSLRQMTGYEFPYPEMYDREYLSQLLHCQTFQAEHFFSFLENFSLEDKSIDWFVEAFSFLQHHMVEVDKMDKAILSHIKMFPIRRGDGHQLKSLSEGEILRDVPSDVLRYHLGDFIQILHPTLVNDRTRVFLEKCNVHSADSRKISDIILLRHSLHDVDFDRVCEAETVMEHLRFICDHIKEIGGNVRVLRDTLWMPCQEGKMCRGEELYHTDRDLQRIFKGERVQYLYGEKREDREWMDFMTMMGVSVVPKVKHIAGRGYEVSPELVSCLADKDSGALEYIDKHFSHYNAAEANVVIRHVNEHVRLRTTSNVYECISATYDHPKLQSFSPYLPCLNLEVLTHPSLLKGLAPVREIDGYVLDRINDQLKRSNVPEDKRQEVWNDYYTLCEQFNHPCEDVYIDGSHLRLSKVIWDGDDEVMKALQLAKLADRYPKLENYFTQVVKVKTTPSFHTCYMGILNIVWSDHDERIFRPKEEIPPMLPVIQKIYRILNDISDDQGKSTLWILSYRCIFFSPRLCKDKLVYAVPGTVDDKLVDIYYGRDGKRYFPLNMVHPLLSEFPELLKLHDIPRISERNVSRPLPSTKPYESTSLTLRLRSSARFILKVSGRVLTKEEKERLEDIADRTRVEYSLGEGLTRRVRADHYVDGERGVLMIDKKRENSKIEDLARLLIPEIVGGEEGISFTDGILREFMEQEKMKERRPVIEVVHMEDQYTLLKEAGDLVITLPTRKNPSAPVKVDGTRDDGGRHIQKVKYRMDVTLRNLRLIQMNDSPDEYVHYSGEKEADMHTPSGGRHIQETDDLSNDTYVGYVREDDSNMQAEWMDYEGEDPVQMDDDTPSFKSYAGMRHRLKQLERLPHDDLYHSLSPSNEAAPPSTTVESAAPSDRGAALPQIESDFADLLGKMGECYAYRTLLQVCRGKSVEFDEYNWVSRYSTRFFPEKRRETCDDGLGYDLFIDDMEGVFNGKPSKFLFEVKGHVTDHVTAFRMSKNEWRRAETSLETSHEVHVIMGVVVHPVPRIVYTLVNVSGQDVTREADGWLISGFKKGGTRMEELMRGRREEEKGGASKKEQVHAEVKETRAEIPVEEKKERVQTKKEKPAKREQKIQAGKIEETREKVVPAQKKKKYDKKVQSETKGVQGKK
ncbi:hypothetical protein PROFUN_08117 [Planoprotostelium fungivorum]|uniref:Protein NO VEIN C-terminal domain-containing protein n=1 Tax=Planoprotostelium fungivorum TaxID=1890364 RepID=A0A2P6NKE1_9EUKA|nr:hypothetical protein PROFUN_08117 [Planoprotostelium fungivorum]